MTLSTRHIKKCGNFLLSGKEKSIFFCGLAPRLSRVCGRVDGWMKIVKKMLFLPFLQPECTKKHVFLKFQKPGRSPDWANKIQRVLYIWMLFQAIFKPGNKNTLFPPTQ